MTSNILTQLGLGGLDIGLLIIIITVLLLAVIILNIVLIVKLSGLKKRYEKFMQGSKAMSLEDEIADLIDNVNQLNEESAIHEENINNPL